MALGEWKQTRQNEISAKSIDGNKKIQTAKIMFRLFFLWRYSYKFEWIGGFLLDLTYLYYRLIDLQSYILN